MLFLRWPWLLVPLLVVEAYFLAVQSIYKGWLFFVVAPALVVVAILIVCELFAAVVMVRRRPPLRYRVWAEVLALAALASTASATVTVVGIGDTEEVFLFGRLSVSQHDPLVTLSWRICGASLVVLLISMIALLTVTILGLGKAQAAGRAVQPGPTAQPPAWPPPGRPPAGPPAGWRPGPPTR